MKLSDRSQKLLCAKRAERRFLRRLMRAYLLERPRSLRFQIRRGSLASE